MNNNIPAEVTRYIADHLTLTIKKFTPVAGGCINSGGRLQTDSGDFFLKWNSSKKFPGMFAAEAEGLNALRNPGVIHVPKVIATASQEEWQFILLEFVEPKEQVPGYWEMLGSQLAALHRQSNPLFGFTHDNYIGSLSQLNSERTDWIAFFTEQRLSVQVDLALKNLRIDSVVVNQFDALFKKLPSLIPQEKPSLLHGDLWSGNLITYSTGEPCLIDPAVYYGSREAEIAYTRLFGGFSPVFYESYNKNFPLLPGFSERSEVYNLYPLMVHVNLFGGGYLSSVVSILKKYV
jgi:protein-ribulosamine 3-kinase